MDDLDYWLEDLKGFSRFALKGTKEESVWICQACGEEGDPYEGKCECEEVEA